MSDHPEQIRAAARAITALAGQAREEATRVTGFGDVHWASIAADRYRDRLRDRATDYAQRAADLDELARALLAHARRVNEHEQLARAVAAGLDRVPGGALRRTVVDLVGDATGWRP